MELDNIVGGLIETMSVINSEAYESMPFLDYIREYRTIGVIAPRQSGKTTLLEEIFDATENTALQFVCNLALNPQRHIHIIDRRVFTFAELKFLSIDNSLPLKNEKISVILVDEFTQMNSEHKMYMNTFIDRMYRKGNIDENFFVLKLGT